MDLVTLSTAAAPRQSAERDAVDALLSGHGFFEAPLRCRHDGDPEDLVYVRKQRLWQADPLAMIRRVMQRANVALCRVGCHGSAAEAALLGAPSLPERIEFCGLELSVLTTRETSAGAAPDAGLEDLDVLVSSQGGLPGLRALLEAALDSTRLCAVVQWGSLPAPEVEAATRVACDHGFLLDRESASDMARVFLRSSVIRDPAGWLAANNAFGRREFRFSALGRVGQFGNQLFQIMHLLLSSLRHNARASTCAWPLNHYFRLGFLEAPGQGRKWEVAPGMWQIMAVWALEELPDDIDYHAHLQWIAPFLSRHAAFLNRCFDLKPEWAAPARRMIDALRAGGTTLTAFHVRRTDYLSAVHENIWHREIPIDWYRRALETRRESTIFAASDDLEYVEQALPGMTLISHRQLGACGLPPLLIDHCVMRAADTLLMVNSTFSRTAGLLAAAAQNTLLPSLREGAFACYSPWHDPVFWSRFEDRHFADPQQHADAVERWLAAIGVPQLRAHE